jgi:rhamnopyranosyl-N-acetylglucosaminyl-diphospho-decaprenol beta-1,3/1,4-galactofuranosyltransferase
MAGPEMRTENRWAAIVVTYKRPESVRRTVASLQSQSVAPSAIIVVDNAGDVEALVGARVVQSGGNLGYGGGLAVGCDQLPADVDFVLFCDDDSTAPTDVVERLLAVARSDPRIGVVGTDGGLVRWGRPRHGEWRGTTRAGGVSVREVDFTLVDHALVRRAALDQVGAPDPDLFMAMEDIEFTTRVGAAGWRVVAVDGAVDRDHLGSGSKWRRYYQVRNHALIARKRRSAIWWAGWVRRTLGMLTAALVARDWQVLGLRMRGAWDGLRGVSGVTIGPQ